MINKPANTVFTAKMVAPVLVAMLGLAVVVVTTGSPSAKADQDHVPSAANTTIIYKTHHPDVLNASIDYSPCLVRACIDA